MVAIPKFPKSYPREAHLKNVEAVLDAYRSCRLTVQPKQVSLWRAGEAELRRLQWGLGRAGNLAQYS